VALSFKQLKRTQDKINESSYTYSFIGVYAAVSFHRPIHHILLFNKKRLKLKKVKVFSDTDGAILLRLLSHSKKFAPFKNVSDFC
jgi:hypothetical protein